MPKKVVKPNRVEQIVKLLNARCDDLYDRVPQPGKRVDAVKALAEEIVKIK